MKEYTAVVERCPDTGIYVRYVPGFPRAHTQAATLDELNENLQEVIQMLLTDGEPKLDIEFVLERKGKSRERREAFTVLNRLTFSQYCNIAASGRHTNSGGKE